jgi:hypothetical protein
MCVLTNSLVNGSLGPLTKVGVRGQAVDVRNLPKPVKVTLRMMEKVAKSPDELVCWIKDLNSGLNTENWRVLDRLPEPKTRGLSFLQVRIPLESSR